MSMIFYLLVCCLILPFVLPYFYVDIFGVNYTLLYNFWNFGVIYTAHPFLSCLHTWVIYSLLVSSFIYVGVISTPRFACSCVWVIYTVPVSCYRYLGLFIPPYTSRCSMILSLGLSICWNLRHPRVKHHCVNKCDQTPLTLTSFVYILLVVPSINWACWMFLSLHTGISCLHNTVPDLLIRAPHLKDIPLPLPAPVPLQVTVHYLKQHLRNSSSTRLQLLWLESPTSSTMHGQSVPLAHSTNLIHCPWSRNLFQRLSNR